MKKSKHTPDPLRDAPVGDAQAPGLHSILPVRSYGDKRFNQYPMTYRVLGIVSSHASSYTGTFFVNQKTIAELLDCSQQAVSHHFTKLLRWGYLEKVRNQDVRRAYGKKGAVWRVIYDPQKTLEDTIIKSDGKDPLVESEEARKTLAFIQGNDDQPSPKPVDNFIGNKVEVLQGGDSIDTFNKVDIVCENKPQLVNNYNRLTNNNIISQNECNGLCQSYASIVQATYGRPWTYDMRQLELARELLSMMTIEVFNGIATDLCRKMKDKNKPAPHSLKYFISMKNNKGKPMDAQAIVKMVAGKMKLPR